MGDDRHARLVTQLESLASRAAGAAGLELVELSVRGPSSRRIVRVDIDRAGPRGVTLEDCQRVSASLDEQLEASETLPNRFVLEVSSPGLDRPIRSSDDIRRNTGRRVVVRTSEPVEGGREFRGVLLGEDAGSLLLSGQAASDEAEVRIPLELVEQAQQEIEF